MRRVVLGLLTSLALALALIAWLGLRGDADPSVSVPAIATDLVDPVARGAYLATVANCRGCHTAHGGAPYAGGREIPTRFGSFYAPNLTPDPETGLGAWTAQDFWLALHEGRGREGEPLYPVFPYTHYTRLSRADSDALYAYLRSLPPVQQSAPEHALRFPYNQRALLVAWRALFFRPGVQTLEAARDETWNRGAYLVQGLGHCGACHESRNALGAIQSRERPAGGIVLNWFAPALDSSAQAGVMHWTQEQAVALLQTGVTQGASTLGPMAEVVYDSLQHWRAEDLDAMVVYLRALEDRGGSTQAHALAATDPGFARGAATYAKHCADCHGERGEGLAPSAPALAGNRTLTLDPPVNLIRTVLYGGYAPGTAGNPQPYGMPPYHATLSDQDIADLLSYLRGAWGHQAAPLRAFEVGRERTGPLW